MMYCVLPNACRTGDKWMRLVHSREVQQTLAARSKPLLRIFRFYQQRTTQPTISVNTWLHMLGRLGLYDHALSPSAAFAVYEAVSGEQGRLPQEHATNDDSEIVYSEWLHMLAWVALAKRRWELSPQAVGDFLEHTFLPACQRVLPFRLDF